MPTIRQKTALLALLSLVSFSLGVAATSALYGHQNAVKACQELRKAIPGVVHFPGTSDYLQDIEHYEQAATRNSTCGVAPKTVKDVQAAIKIIGRIDIRSPFAIKSGGHAFNPGFSSTPGVQISLHNLLDFSYNPSSQTVKLGTGWTWDQVYAKLQPENVTVVGGRIPGVGLGLLYGGGLSWYTNQHGLASDNAVAFDLVLPNGTYVNVTQKTQPDLYFALRGGLNNFGIITGVTLKTWPTGGVWGGNIAWSIDYNDQIMKAVEEFSVNNTDPKAQLQAVYTVTPEKKFWQILFFYDAPDATPEPFKDFLALPSTSDTTKVTTHSQFVKDSPFPPVIGSYLHTVPIKRYTLPILQSVKTAIDSAYTRAASVNASTNTLYWFAEPFYNAYTHSSYPSAFPHTASNPTTPSCFWFNYDSVQPSQVEFFRELIIEAGKEVQATVVKEGEGRWDDTRYSNYAVKGMTVDDVFGESMERLKKIKKSVDPQGIMRLQGEGFLL